MKICFGVKEGFFLYSVADVKVKSVDAKDNDGKEDAFKQYFVEIVFHTLSGMMVRLRTLSPYYKDSLGYLLSLIIEQISKHDQANLNDHASWNLVEVRNERG